MRSRQLVDTLLYEGYALYPYTPGATKNATPTPFGIVYPPVYAAGSGATFDHLQIECVAEADGDATLAGEVRFLQASGRAPPGASARRRAAGGGRSASSHGDVRGPSSSTALRGRVRLSARSAATALRACAARRTTRTAVGRGLDRTEALLHSLLSTHVVGARRRAGASSRRCERREALRERQHLPVLATQADDARARRGDHAARPPADRAREPRQPVRLRPRSRRRCCCTCSPSATTSARRSRSRTRPCAR